MPRAPGIGPGGGGGVPGGGVGGGAAPWPANHPGAGAATRAVENGKNSAAAVAAN